MGRRPCPGVGASGPSCWLRWSRRMVSPAEIRFPGVRGPCGASAGRFGEQQLGPRARESGLVGSGEDSRDRGWSQGLGQEPRRARGGRAQAGFWGGWQREGQVDERKGGPSGHTRRFPDWGRTAPHGAAFTQPHPTSPAALSPPASSAQPATGPWHVRLPPPELPHPPDTHASSFAAARPAAPAAAGEPPAPRRGPAAPLASALGAGRIEEVSAWAARADVPGAWAAAEIDRWSLASGKEGTSLRTGRERSRIRMTLEKMS